MRKKKAVQDSWCPLAGPYAHSKYDHVIERARALWSRPGVEARHPDGRILSSLSFTREATEKARAIYAKWADMQQDPAYIGLLESKMQMALDPEVQDREGYLREILLWFRELDASPAEVFSIMAIHEARVSKDTAWPTELLALTEKFSPDAMRGKKFKRQSGGSRCDALRRVATETFLKFTEEHTREPSARELREALPLALDGAVQEIDEEDKLIYWRNGEGKEKKTTFKTFDNALSGLRKELRKK